MKKPAIVVIIVFIVIVAGSVFYVLRFNDSATHTNATNSMSSEPPTELNDSVNQGSQASSDVGLYEPYSEIALSSSQGDVYLFFHASWCPQCRSIESGIHSETIPGGVTILKVDYDSNQALRKKYDVTIQTTFVKVTKDGNKISSYVAYDKPTFAAVKSNFIK